MAAPVTFRGMPARRFWELENAAVDIGALTAGAEDLGRLLLREFALVYGWAAPRGQAGTAASRGWVRSGISSSRSRRRG